MLRLSRAAAFAAAIVSCDMAFASEATHNDPTQVRPEPRPTEVLAPVSQRLDAAWLAAQPAATGGSQWRCLTEALYFEARGEGVAGQFAVAEVILNRVDSRRFPASVCGVVGQGTGRKWQCQFTYRCDGLPETIRDRGTWQRLGKIARLAMDGAPRDLTSGAMFYHTRAVSPSWSRVFLRTTTIGSHHFYSPDAQLASS